MQFPRRTSFVILAATALAGLGCSDEPKLTDEELARLDERAREIDRQHQEAAERKREELARSGRPASDKVNSDPAVSPKDKSSEPPTSPPSSPPKPPPPGDKPVRPAATPDSTAASKDSAKADAALARARSPAALRWRQLRSGMKQDDVRKLLGAPTSTSADIVVVYWYYGSGPAAGKVSFLKGSGQLLAWDEPLD